MRLLADTEDQAKSLADLAHGYMIGTDAAYAASVEAGQTLRWAVPQQDEAGQWSIVVESRCLGAFTDTELLRLDPPLEVAPDV